MATIKIEDLERNYELDKKALTGIRGGYVGGYCDWQANWYAPMAGYYYDPYISNYYANYYSGFLDYANNYGLDVNDICNFAQYGTWG